MELLTAHQLTRYQRGEPLFQPLDLRLRKGTRIGVVGPNGSGKSTLLRLLAGLEPADEGRVVRPPGVRVALLPQASPDPTGEGVWDVAAAGLKAVREAEARLRQEERRLARGEPRDEPLAEALATFEALGGYTVEAKLREVLAALGFSEADYPRSTTGLSGGGRRRLGLAAVLAGGPEVLLLDEPTNHLDLSARAWLGARLARWPGAVVVVSHDRALLARATNATLFLDAGGMELRRGEYWRARQAREHELHALRRRDAEREREAERLRRMAAALARRGGRGAARRRHVAERTAASWSTDRVLQHAPAQSRLRLAGRGAAGVLLDGRALERTGVVKLVTVRLAAGRKVALVGANGSGKSTVLGLLAGSIPSDDPHAELRYAPRVRLAEIGQLDRGLEPALAVLDQLERVTPPARARRALADAGLVEARWRLLPEALSGGERARAGLALLAVREADLLLLDEPSNDLDLAAIEALERALQDSRAAVVLATHDRRLAERIADEVWAVEGGRVLSYPDVDAYLSRRPAASSAAVDANTDTNTDTPTNADAAPAPARSGPTARSGRVAPLGTPDTAATTEQDTGSATGPATGPDTRPDAGPDTGPATAHDPVEALEDEALAVDRLLEDPLLLAPRELDRLRERRRALDDALALAYDARLEPPQPRFAVHEQGLRIVADRLGNDLLAIAVDGGAAGLAMAALLRLQGSETPPPAAQGDAALVATWPWARVTRAGPLAHVAITEPRDACLLPWARAAFVSAVARLAFLLLDVSALQLFCSEALPDTPLQDAGGGWWTWTRTAFERHESWPHGADRGRRSRHRRANGGRRRTSSGRTHEP
ncbi:MAG: ATP-binding cassette domain-containing protein [Deinococcales bacterium]